MSNSQYNYNTTSHKGLQSNYSMPTEVPASPEPSSRTPLPEPPLLPPRRHVAEPAKPGPSHPKTIRPHRVSTTGSAQPEKYPAHSDDAAKSGSSNPTDSKTIRPHRVSTTRSAQPEKYLAHSDDEIELEASINQMNEAAKTETYGGHDEATIKEFKGAKEKMNQQKEDYIGGKYGDSGEYLKTAQSGRTTSSNYPMVNYSGGHVNGVAPTRYQPDPSGLHANSTKRQPPTPQKKSGFFSKLFGVSYPFMGLFVVRS